MKTASLDLTLVSTLTDGDYASCWCRLEQILPDEADKFANAADVYNLWITAATGNSAAALRPNNCPVEFEGSTITAFLGFYVWPSNPGLDYLLSSTFGKFTNPRFVTALRSFSVMIDNQSRYALPYFMTSVSTTWETPVFNARQEEIIPKPTVKLESGIWLVMPEPCFGALRVTGVAQGKSIVLELEFTKVVTEEDMTTEQQQLWQRGPNGEIILTQAPSSQLVGYSVIDFKNVISVSYSCPSMSGGDNVETGDLVNTDIITDQHDTILPQCLKDILSWCPGQFDIASIFCEKVKTTRIYYNSCTGSILGHDDKTNGQSYCSKVVDSPKAGSGWLPGDETQ